MYISCINEAKTVCEMRIMVRDDKISKLVCSIIYEDGDGGGLFDKYMNSYVAVRAVKEKIGT